MPTADSIKNPRTVVEAVALRVVEPVADVEAAVASPLPKLLPLLPKQLRTLLRLAPMPLPLVAVAEDAAVAVLLAVTERAAEAALTESPVAVAVAEDVAVEVLLAATENRAAAVVLAAAVAVRLAVMASSAAAVVAEDLVMVLVPAVDAALLAEHVAALEATPRPSRV